MGNWTSITINGKEISYFKDHLPLAAIILFDESDLICEKEEVDVDETESPVYEESYTLQSTVSKVIHVLDNRGIDRNFCKKLFENLKAPVYYDGSIGDESPNNLTYDTYSLLLQEHYFGERPTSDEDDPLLGYRSYEHVLFETDYPSLFWGENWYFYDEFIHIAMLRTLCEVAPENAEVSLSLFDLDDFELKSMNPFQYFVNRMAIRIELDYVVYGFVIQNDPNLDLRLLKKVQSLDEDTFIKLILVPLMKAIGFSGVKSVASHGQGEFGKDILPFRKETEFGAVRYLALQAKAVTIHGSAGKSGNAAELLAQATNAFNVEFVDSLDNEKKQIDEFIIATSQEITSEAKQSIESGIRGNRQIIFLDIHQIVTLLKKYKLSQYVLFSVIENSSS